MNKIAASLFGAIGIALTLCMLFILFACAAAYAENTFCASVRVPLQTAMLFCFPLALGFTYYSWKFARKNNFLTPYFRGIFTFSRSVYISSLFLLLFIIYKS